MGARPSRGECCFGGSVKSTRVQSGQLLYKRQSGNGHCLDYGCGAQAKWSLHDPTSRAWSWEKNGEPFELFMQAFKMLGKQFAALGVICVEVFCQSAREAGHFMRCDTRTCGFTMAAVCELTKAFARYFPLLALVVSLLVAVRIVLRSRIYYEMLRHGALVDFQNLNPLKDPLFVLVLAAASLAFTHFVAHFGHTWWEGNNVEALIAQLKSFLFYITPTAAFVAFLYESYDIEAKLVPLSKYLEEDPEEARSKLLRTAVLSEEVAAIAASQGLCQDSAETITAAELYQALVTKAQKVQQQKDSADHGSTSSSTVGLEATTFSKKWSNSTLETSWPARVLLDRRLQDEGDVKFRKLWYVFLGSAYILTALVVFFFILQAKKDVDDVRDGQVEDLTALTVEVVYAVVTVKLVYDLYTILHLPMQ